MQRVARSRSRGFGKVRNPAHVLCRNVRRGISFHYDGDGCEVKRLGSYGPVSVETIRPELEPAEPPTTEPAPQPPHDFTGDGRKLRVGAFGVTQWERSKVM
jgi:hypothetical protein